MAWRLCRCAVGTASTTGRASSDTRRFGDCVLQRPELGVLEKGVPGGEAADDEAGAAVEQAAAEKIELQEAERGGGEHAEPGRTVAGGEGVEGGPVGVAMLLGDEAIEVEGGVGLQRMDRLGGVA